MTLTEWNASDDDLWHHYQDGIAILFSAWVTRAVQEFCHDPAMLSAIPSGEEPGAWLQANLEKHRSTFYGSPNDPDIREKSRQVGFAHIHAHVLPSAYVTLYNLMFDAYHALEQTPCSEILPPLALVRRRWLADMRTTLDTYETALAATLSTLDDLAHTDALTGFLNRRGLQQQITKDFAKGTQAGFFAIIDLDHYKAINDRYGHPHGDTILARFAAVARSMAHPADALARVGGDEFVWWISGITSLPALIHRLIMLDHAIREECYTTFSVGIAQYPQDGSNLDALYRVADQALYRAKHAGRHAYALSMENPMPFARRP